MGGELSSSIAAARQGDLMVTFGVPAKLLGVMVLANLGLVWLMWSEGRRLESLVEQAVVTAQVRSDKRFDQSAQLQQSLIDSLTNDLISLRSSTVSLSDFKQLQNEVAQLNSVAFRLQAV